jgi:HSP20 family protein
MSLHSVTVRDPDRLTARVFDSATRTSGCRLEAYREGDTYVIDIDLPGVDPASIDVMVDRQVLTVRAERKHAEEPSVTEQPAGALSREVTLSDTLDTDRLEARHDNGVLTLTIPLITSNPRRVEVTRPGLAHAA